MGTVDKIVDSLLVMGTEKKNLASKRYNEFSGWLKGEIDLIKALLDSSPRNSSYTTAQEGPAERESVSSESASAAPTSSEGSQRNKRRSPETRMVGASSGESPEQKRSSYDLEEIAVAAGMYIENHMFSSLFDSSLLLHRSPS